MKAMELTGVVEIGGDEPRVGGVALVASLREAFPELGKLTACVASGGPAELYDRAVEPGGTPGPIFTFSEEIEMWIGTVPDLRERLAGMCGQLVHVRVDDA